MPARVLGLGDLQVTSRNSKQSVLLTSSITLEMPTSIDEQAPLSDIADMTRSGQLWIAKAATSRLEVAASLQGAELTGGEGSSMLRQFMVETTGACPIWDDLNLKLRKEQSVLDDEAQPDAYTSFVVNHPDLSSDFLSPKDIPCAKLLVFTCDVCYGPRPRRKHTKKQTKRRKIDRADRALVQAKFGLRRKTRPSYRESDSDDEEEDDGQMRQEDAAPLLKSQDSGIGLDSQDAAGLEQTSRNGLGPEELRRDVELLLRAALIKILGIKKVTPGVRIVRDLAGPSLMDIAPAVFNIRYLQAFASRAEHIPLIASCLSSLDAESPSLRAKIRSLKEWQPDREAAEEVQKRLHMLVQRGLDVSPLVPSKRRAGARAATNEQQEVASLQLEPATEQDSLETWSQHIRASQQREAVLQQDCLDPFSQDEMPEQSQEQVENAEEEPSSNSWRNPQQTNHERQQQFRPAQFDLPDSGHCLQQQSDRGDWLDLSQARYILDENGQRITFEDLDHEEHSYELVLLGSDDLLV